MRQQWGQRIEPPAAVDRRVHDGRPAKDDVNRIDPNRALFLSLDGESNWFEGVLLLAIYCIIAIIYFFVPSAVVTP